MKRTPPSNHFSIYIGVFFKNLTIILSFLVIVSIVVWISLLQFRSPKIVPINGDMNQFSAERAFEHLRELAVKPHPIGTEEHDRVRDYLVRALTDLGVSPETQKTKSSYWDIEGDEVEIENIIARIPGKDHSKAIMLSAHYDSVEDSPGAADDGAAVAAILETVRVLINSPSLKNDVIILISDGEEYGLLGAQSFVNSHPFVKDIGLVFNFEARGSSGPSILIETNEGNERLISEFIKGTPNPVAHSFLYEVYKRMPNDTDFSIYKNSGINGLNFAFFEGLKNYHTLEDNIENLSPNSLQHHGEYMVNLLQHFGNMNIFAKNAEGNKVYFNVMGKRIVSYSEKLVTPLMGLVIICFALTMIHGFKRKKLTVQGIFLGFFFFLLAICFAYFLGYGFWHYLPLIIPHNSSLMQLDLRISHPLFISLILITYSIFSLFYQAVSKKINLGNLIIGAYFSWLLLVIFTSFFMKGTSYIFIWPTLIGLIGVNIVFSLKVEASLKSKVITTIFALPVLIITVPVLYLVYALLSLERVDLLLAFTILNGAFIIPLLNKPKQSFAFELPVILLSVGLLVFCFIK